jgi:predicted nucleic acid-binding Zn ribbon protein
MKDDPISVCPACSGAVKRLLYPVGVVFKGSGWYITDSRKPETTAESSDPKPADTKPVETKAAETKAADARSETVTTS